LPGEEHAELLVEGRLQGFAAGETLIDGADAESTEVFLLLSGSAESIDTEHNPPFRVNVIQAGSFFGERRAVFGSLRQFTVRALEACECFVLPGNSFKRLLSGYRVFSHALGEILRQGQGIFGPFERFLSEVERSVGLGHIELRRLIPLYLDLEPALHPAVKDETVIDSSALHYASRRLPENVTRSLLFLLTDDIPPMYADPSTLFTPVKSDARHRFVYEMLPGKDLVLVRSGQSDLLDFVTCLTAFAVETRKIRYRLNHPDLVRKVVDYARSPAGSRESEYDFIKGLPFSSAEAQSLLRLWPGKVAERLADIAINRQAYSIDIRKQTAKNDARLSELWTQEVGEWTTRVLGRRPSELPSEFPVHIISSNTHSVSNCLNPFYGRHGKEVLRWADSAGLRQTAAGERWDNPYDELYALARDYFVANPAQIPAARAAEAERGVFRLPETVTTGIQVQLIDLSKVKPGQGDPEVSLGSREREGLVVNIDYAFGEQAGAILSCLLRLFGARVRSVNVLGKAGSLVGKRGDVLVPSAFIEQNSELYEPLTQDHEEASLKARLGKRDIQTGPLLTVDGTLLQNRAMLSFYRTIWDCVGLEMEGIYYHRAMEEARNLGLVRDDVAQRYYYYVSDLPLNTGANLSERLSPVEGIPPLYAITREVLSKILGED
jgi:hypothetical protein